VLNLYVYNDDKIRINNFNNKRNIIEMNNPPQPASAAKETILFVGFNQDAGCFTCGTTAGFRIFNTYPFKDTFHRGTHTLVLSCNCEYRI